MNRVNKILLPATVFPFGWRRGHVQFQDKEGTTLSVAVSFRGASNTEKYSVLVSQYISVYPSVDAARNDYPIVEVAKFPVPGWFSPSQLTYESSVADQFRFSCLSITINEVPAHTCTALARYGDVISMVYANIFEDKWFTWEDMEYVLEAIDERMAAEME